jgi:HK97 family phage major capsid protein
MFATTLTEDPASGGKLVVPDYQLPIRPLPTRLPVVADLLMSGTTASNAIIYMIETTYTNAAAPTAEGSLKPESALVFNQVNEPVLKIAHWLPTTEELLEDVAGIQSYIDGRLQTGVRLAEDDQLLNGNGTRPNFTGLLNRAGLAPTITRAGGESIADAIARQISAIATTSYIPPTGVVLHPTDFLAVQISKTSTGDYYGDGPFRAAGPPTLWGLPVAVSPAIAPKLALVGAFATQAQLFRRGGLIVSASNAHQDYFVATSTTGHGVGRRLCELTLIDLNPAMGTRGKRKQPERLKRVGTLRGDAIVRTHGNRNRERQQK